MGEGRHTTWERLPVRNVDREAGLLGGWWGRRGRHACVSRSWDLSDKGMVHSQIEEGHAGH